jgi:hypothetical protein
MARAIITSAAGWPYAPQGHTVVVLPHGSIVEGDWARMAIDMGAASPMVDYATKIVSPPEVKAAIAAEQVPRRRGRPRKAT